MEVIESNVFFHFQDVSDTHQVFVDAICVAFFNLQVEVANAELTVALVAHFVDAHAALADRHQNAVNHLRGVVAADSPRVLGFHRGKGYEVPSTKYGVTGCVLRTLYFVLIQDNKVFRSSWLPEEPLGIHCLL